MKNKKMIAGVAGILVIAIAVLGSSFTPADSAAGYATMNIYENFSIVNSMIVITYPDETTEVIDLGPFKYNAEYLQDNGKTVTRALNMMREKGFTIVSAASSGKINSNKAMRITTIILEKD